MFKFLKSLFKGVFNYVLGPVVEMCRPKSVVGFIVNAVAAAARAVFILAVFTPVVVPYALFCLAVSWLIGEILVAICLMVYIALVVAAGLKAVNETVKHAGASLGETAAAATFAEAAATQAAAA